MPVSLDNLSCNRFWFQSEFFTYLFFNLCRVYSKMCRQRQKICLCSQHPLPASSFAMFLFISSYQSANLSPKVIGSAWTPWLLPIAGVFLYLYACFLSTGISSFMSLRIMSAASFIKKRKRCINNIG